MKGREQLRSVQQCYNIRSCCDNQIVAPNDASKGVGVLFKLQHCITSYHGLPCKIGTDRRGSVFHEKFGGLKTRWGGGSDRSASVSSGQRSHHPLNPTKRSIHDQGYYVYELEGYLCGAVVVLQQW